jgi:hypothetical protein
MQPQKRSLPAILACLFVLVVWVVIGFVIFSPQAPFNDCRVKYVQVQSLIQNGFRSMALAYPGSVFDKEREFFPFRPPFTLNTTAGVQTIWSPAVIMVQTPFVLAGGFGGLVALSLLSGVIILWMTVRLGGRLDDWALPIGLGFGTCLWYYAVEPWEHVPAIAAVMVGLWLAATTRRRAVLFAALVFGIGVVLRDEALLLVPTLLLLVWYTHRRFGALLIACGGVGSVVLAAAMLDFFVFGRPPAAHLLHHVSLLRSVFNSTFPTRAVSAAPVLSFADRYNTVVHYWLTSSLSRLTVLAYIGAVVVAAAIARWARSSIGVLVVALVMLLWSAHELWMLVPAPRSIPSLFPLSPFLVFAMFPVPDLPPETRRMRRLLLGGSVICVVLAILTTDATGGKSFGPRMVLGLLPLLTISSWAGITGYLRAGRADALWRVIGWVGVLLVVIGIWINSCALRLWARRIEGDRQALVAVARSPVRVVVADDPYTAQSLMPCSSSVATRRRESRCNRIDCCPRKPSGVSLCSSGFGRRLILRFVANRLSRPIPAGHQFPIFLGFLRLACPVRARARFDASACSAYWRSVVLSWMRV